MSDGERYFADTHKPVEKGSLKGQLFKELQTGMQIARDSSAILIRVQPAFH